MNVIITLIVIFFIMDVLLQFIYKRGNLKSTDLIPGSGFYYFLIKNKNKQ
jgi:hypothetical protein